jgi:hypothetical protein
MLPGVWDDAKKKGIGARARRKNGKARREIDVHIRPCAFASAEEELRRSRTRLGSSCGKSSDYSGRHVRRWRCSLLRAPPPCSKREKWGVPQPNTRQEVPPKKSASNDRCYQNKM